MKNLIFLCISVAIVLFTVIVLNNAPIINGLVGENWYKESCQNYVDLYKYNKDVDYSLVGHGVTSQEKKKEWLDLLKEGKNKCYRNKAMIGLEYASFNFNIVFGLTCAILGLLNYLNVANNIKKIIGLIGLASGIIGFVLTFVYIIYSGIIFTQDVVDKSYIILGSEYSGLLPKKVTSDGAFAKWDNSKNSYVCIFYDKDNKDKLYLKYSDYGNKYLNYNSKLLLAEKKKDYKYMNFNGCVDSYPSYSRCEDMEEGKHRGYNTKLPYYDSSSNRNNKVGECDKLYYYEGTDFEKQNTYDCWVTTIVLGCFIFVLDIGLAIFGLLLFLDSSGSKGAPL